MTTASTPERPAFLTALRQQKWLTLIGLPILIVASLNDIYAIWGVLFVYWGIASAVVGDVFLLETIRRRDDPVLFWIIVVMWIAFGLMYVAYDALPYL